MKTQPKTKLNKLIAAAAIKAAVFLFFGIFRHAAAYMS